MKWTFEQKEYLNESGKRLMTDIATLATLIGSMDIYLASATAPSSLEFINPGS